MNIGSSTQKNPGNQIVRHRRSVCRTVAELKSDLEKKISALGKKMGNLASSSDSQIFAILKLISRDMAVREIDEIFCLSVVHFIALDGTMQLPDNAPCNARAHPRASLDGIRSPLPRYRRHWTRLLLGRWPGEAA